MQAQVLFAAPRPGEPEPVRAKTSTDASTVGARPLERIRLLFVDDEPHAVRSLISALRAAGASVDFLETGMEAADRLRTVEYDVMVLDLNLPGGLSGEQLLRAIRLNGIPLRVIVLTGRGPADDPVGEAQRLGADYYVAKPIKVSLLVRIVQATVNSPYVRTDLAASRSSTAARLRDSRRPLDSTAGALAAFLDECNTSVMTAPMVGADLQRRFLSHLFQVLLDETTNAPAFWTAAQVLKQVHEAPPEAVLGIATDLRPRLRQAQGFDPNRLEEGLRAVIAKMEEAGTRVLRLLARDLAPLCHVSATQVGRRLSQFTGLGVCEWRWVLALKPAVRALALTERPIKEIAYECGFSTKKHATNGFERIFDGAFGMNPSALRRAYRLAFSQG